MNDYRFSLLHQIAARLRKTPVREIKKCLRIAQDNSIPITAAELEAHHLSSGRIVNLIAASVFAKEKGIAISMHRLIVQDLAKGDQYHVRDWLADRLRSGVRDFETEPIE